MKRPVVTIIIEQPYARNILKVRKGSFETSGLAEGTYDGAQ